jgi:hypothetical protein
VTAIAIAEKDIVPRFVTGNLVNGTTYYFPVGAPGCLVTAIHAIWDAALIITALTVEDCNVANSDPTVAGRAGLWIQENPTGAYVAVTGAGVTATNLSVAATGGAIGGAMIHLGNLGSRLVRIKVVVGATGGKFELYPHGKD